MNNETSTARCSKRKPTMRFSRTIGITGVSIIALVYVSSCGLPVRLNISASLPYGVYLMSALPPVLSHGTLVLLPVPESIRPWYSRWLPILKPVAGLAGDVVCNVEGVLWLWTASTPAQSYGWIHTMRKETPLLHLTGCTRVEEGMVFLASTAPRSLDSRYFGPVATSALTAHATPLLTW